MPSYNPYSNLPSFQRWDKSVTSFHEGPIDPHWQQLPKFTIDKDQRVISAGSCFAQRISESLKQSGFNYYLAESAPPGTKAEIAERYGYGIYSARYGNIYTARQLLQLVQRCMGRLNPLASYWGSNTSCVDPFRPRIQPNPYSSLLELEYDREKHLMSVRQMFESADVFIFTIGLTESWIDRRDGTVFPVCPASVGAFDQNIHLFHNFSYTEVVDDLNMAKDLLWQLNKSLKIIVTVSPVPLVATQLHQSALLSNSYSKSVLRAATEQFSANHPNVQYFGSYEIITSPYNSSLYDTDRRNVTVKGVDCVMSSFYKFFCPCCGEQGHDLYDSSNLTTTDEVDLKPLTCDEDALRVLLD